MKTLVLYQSQTGFTRQYAQWIASDLKCEARDIKKCPESEIRQYDCIIYGGWIMGNMIMGLDKIKKLAPSRLIVFAVGSSPDSDFLRNTIQEQNQLGEAPFFYMEGGFHFEQLNFLTKMMLKTIKKSVAKKQDKTEQDLYMEKILGTSFDHSNRKYIEGVIACAGTLK